MSSPCVMMSGAPSFDTAFASSSPAIFTLTSAFPSSAGVETATETLESFTPPSASTAPGERPLGIARLSGSGAREKEWQRETWPSLGNAQKTPKPEIGLRRLAAGTHRRTRASDTSPRKKTSFDPNPRRGHTFPARVHSRRPHARVRRPARDRAPRPPSRPTPVARAS